MVVNMIIINADGGTGNGFGRTDEEDSQKKSDDNATE